MKKSIRINGSSEIEKSVQKSLDEYFRKLDGEAPHNIYDMVITNVERTLIASITERLWPMGDDTVFIPGHGPESSFGRERKSNPYVAGT